MGFLDRCGGGAAASALSALCGTVVGSFVWGLLVRCLCWAPRIDPLVIGDVCRHSSICSVAPCRSFWWNVLHVLPDGGGGRRIAAGRQRTAGGNHALTTKHRGWALVLVGGIGAIKAAIFAASALSALAVQPLFGWRIMWFPSNLSHRHHPDRAEPVLAGISPASLQHMGRIGSEARAVLKPNSGA